MTRFALLGILGAIPFAAQAQDRESPEQALFQKCDSQIPWISDGTVLVDGTPKSSVDPAVDREALLGRALGQARERQRLVLWYCMRVPGTHTYRAAVLDVYARVALFTDPGLVDLVASKFVPLRMAADERLGAKLGIRFPQFIEPGLVVLTPEGRVVHVLDRIRTFDADWVRAVLVSILKAQDAYNAPLGDTAELLVRGGDDERALPKATPEEKALIYRRAGNYDAVLKLSCSPVEKGIARLGRGELEAARTLLEGETSPLALYYLSAIHWKLGRDPEPLWRRLVREHPESPWAWQAASNLVRGPDGTRQGPLTHLFQSFCPGPPQGLPTATRQAAADPDVAASRALEFLLEAERGDGTWSDSRYCYGWAAYMIRRGIRDGVLDPGYTSWPDLGLRPNFTVALTAMSARALLEWRELAPERVDRAVERAERFLRDDDQVSPARCEACYAEAFRLLFFQAKKDVPRMNRMVSRLYELQDREGFWAHEYPSAFATAAVVHILVQARKAGADVPDPMLRRAADALQRTRAEGGRQAYRNEPGKPMSSEKNSMGRTATAELALLECGRGSLADVAAGVDAYWKHLSRLEAVRNCDNHADEELAGFFYFNSVYNTLEAVRALGEPQKLAHQAKIQAQMLALPEYDGSFVDSHELGKSYGTATALLILRRLKE